jgi:hypothetical protein
MKHFLEARLQMVIALAPLRNAEMRRATKVAMQTMWDGILSLGS